MVNCHCLQQAALRYSLATGACRAHAGDKFSMAVLLLLPIFISEG
jgi:hypothetical protein